MDRVKRGSKKTFVGIVGGIVLVVGIFAIPLPGPGWAIVFAGLAILATEFEWAQNILQYAKHMYERWQKWLMRQSRIIKGVFFLLTCVVVVMILWLLNIYGYTSDLFKLGLDWVRSPLPWFY